MGATMLITLEPTADIFLTDEGIPVRAWVGQTDQGTEIIAYIAALCATGDQSQLAAELLAMPGPLITTYRVRDADNEL
jgi:hypothetical protein